MKKKYFKSLGMTVCTLVLVLFAVLMVSTVPAKADTGKTVRVSTVKELKSAMKKSGVGTIIFRTQANLTVKIPNIKKASGKELIIDAPNCEITNKTKFLNINILKAASYTEAVSGNQITLTGHFIALTVAKKKTVAELTICDPALPEGNLEYTLRKGAKIKSLKLLYTQYEMPQWSEYDAKTRTVTHSYKNRYEIDDTFIYTLDKAGRVITTEKPHLEFDSYATFKYDKNGNLLTTTCEDARGLVVETFTYDSKGRALTSVSTEDDKLVSKMTYTYDSKGHLTGLVTESSDGYKTTSTYTYDSKGKLLSKISENDNHTYKYVLYYDKNSLKTKMESFTDSRKDTTYEYEYNKRGDLLKESWISTANTKMVYGYYYDELGELIDRDYTDTDGDVHKMTLDGALINSVY